MVVPQWTIASQSRYVHPLDQSKHVAHTWTYEPYVACHWEKYIWKKMWCQRHPQHLDDVADTVRLFPDCDKPCSGCYMKGASSGASTGSIVISELQAAPQVCRIDIFGMNWGGGGEHTEHIDFLHPTLVPTCCTKCVVHPTSSMHYGDAADRTASSEHLLLLLLSRVSSSMRGLFGR